MAKRTQKSRLHTTTAMAVGAAMGLWAGCSDGTVSSPDLGAADLAVAPSDAAAGDLATPPPVIPRYSVGGTVNAVLHAGSSFYLGGTFNRISTVSAPNLIPVDAKGAPTGCPLDSGFDSSVTALATVGNAIYVGGAFTHYKGASANHIAKLDATTCALDTSFSPAANNGFEGFVLGLGVAGNALYVGGQFTLYRGASANRVAKLDLATGALDTTFSPAANNGFDNNVLALAIGGNALYLGGTFNTYRGVASSASRLAKLDLTTGAQDTTFSPVGATSNGFNNTVTALTASATALYVGGFFTDYRGVANSAVRLAKLDLTSGAIDATFSPVGATSNGVDDVIYALAASGNSLYAGGRFTAYRGVSGAATRLAKLDATTGVLDTTFSPATNGFTGTQGTVQVSALAVAGTSLYVGGIFSAYRGVANSAYGLAKLDVTSGGQDLTFLPAGSNANGVSGGVAPNYPSVNAILMQGATVWLGGRFLVYGGYCANNLVKLDDTTFAVDTTFSPPASNGFDNTVNALAVAGTSLYVGGAFDTYRGGTNSAHRLAKLDLTAGGLDATFSPVGATANGFNATVQALAVAGTSLYAGGAFTAYRGTASSANALAKLDLASGVLDTTFSPAGATANGFNSTVQALTVAGASVYAGGSFTAYRGVAGSANRLAKLDATSGGLDTTFSPQAQNGFDGPVNALAVGGASLYVGGGFTAYLGLADSAHRLAKLSLTTGAIDTSFSPTSSANANGFDDIVNGLTVAGNSLYAGGLFTAYRGSASSANRLARLDLNTGTLDTTVSPPGATANGFDGAVNAVGVSGSALVVGGGFSLYRNATALTRALGLLDPATGVLK